MMRKNQQETLSRLKWIKGRKNQAIASQELIDIKVDDPNKKVSGVALTSKNKKNASIELQIEFQIDFVLEPTTFQALT